eukprot:TRINITY_DN25583_c0_g1_i1.p1 TRINITY_DN25583_c0_g1~~TRINITY_DN25583_c0_g1_i1.p1  ORF type:complete len:141 (-),score=39.05 TRINITY_DN25583_c0_g1_i1:57-437(-)
MTEDSGWYWCVADGYQSGLYVQVIRNSQAIVTNTPVTATNESPATLNVPTTSTPGYPVLDHLAQGNADQLSIYQTYDSKWSDHQEQKAKLLTELEAMLARYLKPINRQLDDIYIRVAKMEKQIQQI